MPKYWKSTVPGDDKFIIWHENRLYKANPTKAQSIDFEMLIISNQIPKETFFIPTSQIRNINMEEKKNYIIVHHRTDSSEEFHISDPKIRLGIFDTLKEMKGALYSVKELSVREKTKNLRKAIIGFTILFIFGFLFSLLIENDQLPSGHYPAIILFIGAWGSINVMFMYAIIMIILGFKYRKIGLEKIIVHTIKLRES